MNAIYEKSKKLSGKKRSEKILYGANVADVWISSLQFNSIKAKDQNFISRLILTRHFNLNLI